MSGLRYLDEVPGRLSVFVGAFADEAEFAAFTKESYSEGPETDHLPISGFAASMGLKWYDHDFTEFHFADVITEWDARFCAFSYGPTFATAAVSALAGIQGFTPNAVFIFYETDYVPEAVTDPRVRFVGVFPYKK